MRPTKIINKAIEDGCETVSDFKEWEKEFNVDIWAEDFNKTVDRMFEPFPLFAEESVRLHEEKMAKTEEKERMADYSDQEVR